MFRAKFSGHNCLHFLDQQVLLTHDHQILSRLRALVSKLIGKACLQLLRTSFMLDGNAAAVLVSFQLQNGLTGIRRV